MNARMRFVVAPLLIALLSGVTGGAVAPAFAERDDNRHREDGNRGDKKQERERGGELRDSYDKRYDDRSQRYREPKRPGYPQQPGYPSSPRSYPQPGYTNPIQPGQFRHDPYRENRRRYDQPRDDHQPYDRENDGYRGGYDERDRNDGGRDYDRDQRGYEQQRNYESNGRPLRPVNDVVRQVEGTYGGKVVGVQQAGSEYRVRVLQRDGRVKTVSVPAR